MALSKEETLFFLRDVLRIDCLLNREPSLSSLNMIIKSYCGVIPWQSVSSCALPHSKRHLPTWEETKRRQFAKQGGMCYENNILMKNLLSALNYDVCFTSVKIINPNDHIAIVVRGLTVTSSKHYVDVGSTFPVFEAIPLDFDTDEVEYEIGFLRQRFVKTNGVIEWYHSRHHPPPHEGCKLGDDGWYKFAQIQADVPCDVDVFESRMTNWYTVEEGNELLKAPRAVIFKGSKLVAIKGRQLIVETTNKIVVRKELGSFDEVLAAYKTYFPQIPVEIVQNALKQTIFKI